MWSDETTMRQEETFAATITNDRFGAGCRTAAICIAAAKTGQSAPDPHSAVALVMGTSCGDDRLGVGKGQAGFGGHLWRLPDSTVRATGGLDGLHALEARLGYRR